MELPACDPCNQSTRPYDAIFGFYAMALDFNPENLDAASFGSRAQGICNNYPDAFPDKNLSANQIRRKLKSMGIKRPAGQLLKDLGVVTAPKSTRTAVFVALRKLACALYFKETGRILTPAHRIAGMWQQIQDAQRAPIANYLNDLLPEYRNIKRSNMRNYGKRFCYKFGYMSEDDFFIFTSQIGEGLMLSGMAIPPEMTLPSPMVMPIWRVDDPWDSSGEDLSLLLPQVSS